MASNPGTQTQSILFTGKGGEYFRIWIVNLALSILTLGIYSAWAKVRRLQYFYRNTALAGSSFDYHGDPMAILKGRVIGVGLLIIYNVTSSLNPTIGVGVFVLLLLVFPWLVQRSLRFKLHNSSYRGLRFGFDGSAGGAYQAFLMWPVLGYITAGLLAPLAHQQIKAYQHGRSRFGSAGFSFNVGAGGFYGIYFKFLGLVLGIAVLGGLAAGLFHFMPALNLGGGEEAKAAAIFAIMMAVVGFYLLVFLLLGPWFAARIQNLVWNGTAIGQHVFTSHVRARDLFWLYLTNFIGILLTLGLFKPFADIRLAKYRLEHMALNVQGSLNDFLAGQQQSVNAMGEETAEVFDFDISF